MKRENLILSLVVATFISNTGILVAVLAGKNEESVQTIPQQMVVYVKLDDTQLDRVAEGLKAGKIHFEEEVPDQFWGICVPVQIKFSLLNTSLPRGGIRASYQLGKLLLHDFRLGLHHFPLVFGIGDVLPREKADNDSRNSRNSPIVFVKETEFTKHCYERPHYVLAVGAFLLGLLFFGGACGCWSRAGRSASEERTAGLILAGIAGLGCCIWLLYQSLCLAEFCVAPCV